MGLGGPNGKLASGKVLGVEVPKILWGFAAMLVYVVIEVVKALAPSNVQVETVGVVEVLERINTTQEAIATEQLDILRDSRRILTESQDLLEAAHERGIKIIPVVERMDRSLEEHRRASESGSPKASETR